jgi:hypothetical protein
VRPDGIRIKVWKYLGEISIAWLTILFNNICRVNKTPTEWKNNTLIPLYKNKRGVQDYTNYREIKLMSHTMKKLWERVIEHRLKGIIKISDNQFSFMPERSTIEAIYLLRQMIEYYRKKKEEFAYGIY